MKLFNVWGMRNMCVRFPFSVIASFGAVASANYATHFVFSKNTSIPISLVLTMLVGVILFTALALIAERTTDNLFERMKIQSLGIIPLIFFYLSIVSKHPLNHLSESMVLLFVLWLGSAFVLLLIGQYVERNNEYACWQFSKSLFLRMFFAVFGGIFVFIACVIALHSIATLFDIPIHQNYFVIVWEWIAFVGGPLYVLQGFQRELKTYDNDTHLPELVKKFALYVLRPIAVIYFCIIYSYIVKILFISREWPIGSVALPIIFYCMVIIVSVLLLYPYQTKLLGWLRCLVWTVVPLMPVYFLAIARRIGEYGVTEARYVGILLGVWFVGVVLYTSSVKAWRPTRIVGILGIMMLLISFGPWGVFQISLQSQTGRLVGLFQEYHVLVDGKFQKKNFNELSDEKRGNIYRLARYVFDRGGSDGLSSFFTSQSKEWQTDEEYFETLFVPQNTE